MYFGSNIFPSSSYHRVSVTKPTSSSSVPAKKELMKQPWHLTVLIIILSILEIISKTLKMSEARLNDPTYADHLIIGLSGAMLVQVLGILVTLHFHFLKDVFFGKAVLFATLFGILLAVFRLTLVSAVSWFSTEDPTFKTIFIVLNEVFVPNYHINCELGNDSIIHLLFAIMVGVTKYVIFYEMIKYSEKRKDGRKAEGNLLLKVGRV